MTISKDLLTKILSIFCIIASVVAIVFSIVACCLIKDDSERVYVESVAINEEGKIVVTYTNETNTILEIPVQTGEDGKSAYDLYLETVPEGETPMTVEEWLASLKGTDGVGIANIYISEEGKLVIVLTNYTIYEFDNPYAPDEEGTPSEEETPPVIDEEIPVEDTEIVA